MLDVKIEIEIISEKLIILLWHFIGDVLFIYLFIYV